MKPYRLIWIMMLISPSGFALSAKQIFNLYKPAVVKIILLQHGVPISSGAGVFVSNDGKLITNSHVFMPTLITPGITAEFHLANGQVIKSFEIAGCSEKGTHTDLCYLKLNVPSSVGMKLNLSKLGPGDKIYVIGHPRGYDFTLSEGIVSGLRTIENEAGSFLQITAPISPGNSGGPIIDEAGKLVGIATLLRDDGENLNFGLDASTVSSYTTKFPKFVSLPYFQEVVFKLLAQVREEYRKVYIEPALDLLNKNQNLSTLKNYHRTDVPLPGMKFETYVPDNYADCGLVDPTTFRCRDTTGYIEIARDDQPTKRDLLSLNGEYLVKPAPLSLTQSLIKSGEWESYSKKIPDDEKGFFFSTPSKVSCSPKSHSADPNAFVSKSPECLFTVYNDRELDAWTMTHLYKVNGYMYAFSLRMINSSIEKERKDIFGIVSRAARIISPQSTKQGSDSQRNQISTEKPSKN